MDMVLEIAALREQFPALNQTLEDGTLPVFLDNPAGTQVPQRVIDAVAAYYTHMNANSGGYFATSQRSDAMAAEVRQKVADFINAPSPQEIVFGPNMTTLNLALSRALARTLKPGDEIVLTRMDHDANVAPWLLIAEDYGLTVRWVDINTEDCTLDLNTLEAALTDRTKVVAAVHASNAVGTINPVQQIAAMAHAAGAYFVMDAVQSAPHIPIDVQEIGCDFMLCSAYKFFGPHIGIMWGRYDLLESLPAYKVRPSYNVPPHRWENGTNSYETIAAVGAALDYFAEIGTKFGQGFAADYAQYSGQTLALKLGMAALVQYERELVEILLDVLDDIPGLTVHGIREKSRLAERVPTVAFTMDRFTAGEIAKFLARQHIYVWSGNYYAVEIVERLGLAEHGMLRVGPVHYNTHEEIERLGQALHQLQSS